jgi:hypothetical protein
MDDTNLKIANTLSHSDFAAFARTYLFSVGPSSFKPANEIAEDQRQHHLPPYDESVAALCGSDAGKAIDLIEARRYSLWEAIVDILDDNILVMVDDPNYTLKSIGLDEETAYDEIPIVRASLELLEPMGNDSQNFPSSSHLNGHFWEPEEMATLISRLIDPAHAGLCAEVGIADKVRLLAEVEQEIGLLAPRLPAGLLETLRTQRADICIGMQCVVMHTPTMSSGKYKHPRYIKPYQVFADRFKHAEELERMEMFSLDHLSASAFIKLVDPLKPDSIADDVLCESMRNHLFTNYAKFKKALGNFQSHYLWDRFEAEETSFYQACNRLMDAVTSAMECIDIEDPDCRQEHMDTPTFDAAAELVDNLEHNPFCSYIGWEPNTPLAIENMVPLLEDWGTSENLGYLNTLDCMEKYHECCRLNEITNNLCIEISTDNPAANLEELRSFRTEVSRFLSLIEGYRRIMEPRKKTG